MTVASGDKVVRVFFVIEDSLFDVAMIVAELEDSSV